MEYKFKKVHTPKDLIVSATIFAAGIGLYFLNGGVGFCLGLVGLLMIIFVKSGYKEDNKGLILKKKTIDINKSCRESVKNYLDGKDTVPVVKEGNDGGSVLLEVYYNKAANTAYAQLSDYVNYEAQPVTEMVELHTPRVEKLLATI